MTGALGVATTSTICGPYVLVPTLAAIGTMLLHMGPGRGGRGLPVVANCLAIAIPATLQWLGAMPASYLFGAEGVMIVPGMLSFPPLPTHVFMLTANVAVIVTASLMMGRFRDTLHDVEEKLHVQAWQLRQLVPEEVRPASAPPPPESRVSLPPSVD
jgi:hypothetical protein